MLPRKGLAGLQVSSDVPEAVGGRGALGGLAAGSAVERGGLEAIFLRPVCATAGPDGDG